MESKRKQITLSNNIDELNILATQLEELTDEWQLPFALGMNINLVLEEAITNIIFHAFKDNGKHEIQLTLSLVNDELSIVIEDDGPAFDPTMKEQPDITLPAEERPIGGLGIFLISKLMDSVSYKREQELNKLTLKKKIER